MRKYTDEFLLDELRRFERENGSVPTYNEDFYISLYAGEDVCL